MGKSGWHHSEKTKAKLKISRARYKTNFTPEARLKGQRNARMANIGSTSGVKYKTPEERQYASWTQCNFKKRGFTLSLEQASELMHGNCYYCGDPPFQKIDQGKTKHWAEFSYQGIDRVDNSKGYEEGNCVPCCGICNLMKSDMSQEVFLKQVEKIAEFKNKFLCVS